MKNVPNLITSVRLICALIIVALALAAPDHGRNCFLPLFVAASVSDMLDGFIARHFNCCTAFGATLDSISDLALYVSVSVFLSFTASAELARCAPFLLTGAAAQIFHLAFSYRRFGQFPAYHTTFSRVCAYAIFFAIVAYWLFKWPFMFSLISLLWLCSCLEGIAITHVLKQPMRDLASVFTAMRATG